MPDLLNIELDPAAFREAVTEKAARIVANDILGRKTFVDDEGEEYVEGVGKIMPDLERRVLALVNEAVTKHCDDTMRPIVASKIDTLTIQDTNRYGEAKGKKALTFTEYLVARANEYLSQEVDYNGAAKGGNGTDYNWRAHSTRLVWMISKHIGLSIESPIKAAVAEINKAVAPAIADTVKIKIAEVVAAVTAIKR